MHVQASSQTGGLVMCVPTAGLIVEKHQFKWFIKGFTHRSRSSAAEDTENLSQGGGSPEGLEQTGSDI